MPRKRDEELQRYHDGELDLGQARQVAESLRVKPDDRARLDAMDEMGEMVRISCEDAAAEANFDHLWTRVEAGIGDLEPAGAWSRLADWLRWNRVAAGSALAAAAVLVVALVVTLSSGNPAPARFDVAVEELDVGPDVVSTVMTVDAPDGEGEVEVIWLSDEEGEEETM